ncbi:MAG: substrate-binding domain-containing protein [Lactobacillus apis]|uniref:substrate-binding domain-containing protein n=1 Tax=Lactobacillus TaxID=1578 RepID=UPI0008163022|nr:MULTISPECIES: substrate-binding domain-containing protein [Lactobacillus]MBC6362005.1 LacI family DNA-binding transcriptional regulator [Lactobacillus apis]MCO6529510.1 substrate-binding domain-containing protein [Lactobacillus sp.]MCT6876664.1 substrate-binding domain-containing protein [Lactobacillus apis]RMC51072.1 LacI family DNA-binding transcriptional regulator [Lactobacillus sp. ESL0263]SCC06507.1 transcriptional regulator, LacI family [Lactobacillus apis]
MRKQDITIYDVAREAKVSMATVSRVVNGNTNVRKDTRERVLKVINRLHYQPNAVAQGLASKRTTTVGLIVPDLTNLYFAELSKGIDDIALLYKYNIIITSIENRLMKEDQAIQGLLNKQVDGIIYMSDNLPEEAAEAFKRTDTPVVLAGTKSNHQEFPSVAIDYMKADTEALNLLYNDGKKNLALVLDDPDTVVNAENRIPAYKKFMADHNLGEGHIYSNIKDHSDGYNLYSQLRQDGIDGVIVTRDITAVGILNAATDAGTKIPEEMEIVTASATQIASVVRPALTAIRQPLYDIGAVAMRLLTKLMNNEEIDQKQIELPYELLKKQSTANK